MDTTCRSTADSARADAAPPTALSQEGRRIHLVSLQTHRREPLFEDFESAARVGATLGDARLWRGGRLLAWVLLPDQLELMLEPGVHDTVATAIGRFKRVSATRMRHAQGRVTPLWSPRCACRALGPDEAALGAARHLVTTPLRRGLALRLGDYSWWDALWLDASAATRSVTLTDAGPVP